MGPASPPHTPHPNHNPPHTPLPRRLGGGASTSGLADLRTERRGEGERREGEEEEKKDEGVEGGTYPEGPGASPEGEGLLRDGAGRRGAGDGSEGVITVVSKGAVWNELAGSAAKVSGAVV